VEKNPLAFKTRQDIESRSREVWDSLTYEQKLLATHHVFKVLHEHLRQSGTYRYLIYDRLGFGVDAYGVLIDGLDISNAFFDAKQYGELPINE
jgi:hypothetical protein